MRPARPAVRIGHLWPVLTLLTVLTYHTWVLWRPVNGHARVLEGYLWELSASDRPHSFSFRGGDLITAVIVLGLVIRAVVLWRQQNAVVGPEGRSSRWWVVGSAALLVFGVATFFDAFFAMDCSPVLNHACQVAGTLSGVHYAHTYTSVGAQVGIVASMIASDIAMVRSPGQSKLVERVVLGTAVVEVAALTVMMVMLVLELPGLGYPQAVVVMASMSCAAIGFRLVGNDAVDRHEPAEPDRADAALVAAGRDDA